MTTAEKETIRAAIRQFVIDNFLIGEEKEQLNDSDSFMTNGYIDSTGILELVEHVEENYQITVEDEDMVPENLDSIDNLVRFVSGKSGG